MPILRDSEDIYDNESDHLALELNLLNLMTYPNQTKFEGWIEYELTLYEGEKKLVERNGSIHEDDVQLLENFLGKLKDAPEKEYKPMEPDFDLRIKHFMEEDWELTCMVNYGEVRHKFYGLSAIGLRLRILEPDAQKFANELEEQRRGLKKMTE